MKPRPLFNLPSLGTLGAGPCWFFTFALTVFSPGFTVPLMFFCLFAVTLVAVWKKSPQGFWRGFAILSVATGIALSSWVAPQNERITLDGFIATPPLVWAVYMGIALAPLGLISCSHTAYVRLVSARK